MQNTEGGGKNQKKILAIRNAWKGRNAAFRPESVVTVCVVTVAAHWRVHHAWCAELLSSLANFSCCPSHESQSHHPITIPVPAAAFVGLVLGVVFVVYLPRPRHPLVPCCGCRQFVLAPIYKKSVSNNKIIWKKNILQAQKRL
jgi:hypothetical protein